MRMPATYPEEAKNFRLLGHDASAAWGGGSLVQVHKGHAYVGAVGGSSFNGPEGFTVHDVRDPTNPKKSANSARRRACIATSCASSATICST
jgi:hypothetical protein